MGRSAVLHRVDQTQYRENSTEMAWTIRLGQPSQMRVADSRSYLRITASISAAVPVSASRRSFLSFSLMFTASFVLIQILAALKRRRFLRLFNAARAACAALAKGSGEINRYRL